MSEFRRELKDLINKHSIENGSDTPDFILAEYLSDCLGAFERAVSKMDNRYKTKPRQELGKVNETGYELEKQ